MNMGAGSEEPTVGYGLFGLRCVSFHPVWPVGGGLSQEPSGTSGERERLRTVNANPGDEPGVQKEVPEGVVEVGADDYVRRVRRT